MALTKSQLALDARLDRTEDGSGKLSKKKQMIDDALDRMEGKPDPKHRPTTGLERK